MSAKNVGFPHISLEKSLDKAREIFDKDRSNAISREVAVQHLGYKGTNGASEKMLGTLIHYNLLESAGPGKVRITDLARDILAPVKADDKIIALREAGRSPELFRLIEEHFDSEPSELSFKNWLIQNDFPDRVLQSVMKSYYQTMEYIADKGVSDTEKVIEDNQANKPLTDGENTKPNKPKSKKNDFKIVMEGNLLQIQCSNVDVKGVNLLRQQLDMYEQILELQNNNDDDDDFNDIL